MFRKFLFSTHINNFSNFNNALINFFKENLYFSCKVLQIFHLKTDCIIYYGLQ